MNNRFPPYIFIICCCLALVLTGCFKVGLPEVVSGEAAHSSLSSSLAKRLKGSGLSQTRGGAASLGTVLLLEDCQRGNLGQGDSLGYQFILGIFPLTRLFYQHGVNQLVKETLSQVLQEEGYSVVRSRCVGAAEHEGETSVEKSVEKEVEKEVEIEVESTLQESIAPEQPSPDLDNMELAKLGLADWALEFSLNDIALNGYDLLFARRQVVEGQLTLKVWRGFRGCEKRVDTRVLLGEDNSPPNALKSIDLGQAEYSRYAHAPQLAALFESRLKSEFRRVLPLLLQSRRGKHSGGCLRTHLVAPLADKQFLVVKTPQLKQPLPVGLGHLLSSSYGYDSVPPFSAGEVAAIIRRGLLSGIPQRLVAFEALGSAERHREPQGEGWDVESEVLSVEIRDETLRLGISIGLRPVGAPRSGVAAVSCHVLEETSSSDDGRWVVAFERAAKRAMEKVLAVEAGGSDSSPSITCAEATGQ